MLIQIEATARFVGKYLPPVPCSITVKLGGTQTERIFVWNVKRNDRNDEMTMVSCAGMLVFLSIENMCSSAFGTVAAFTAACTHG
eukprot:1144270-Pelagomonas_calceolata.AAC.10